MEAVKICKATGKVEFFECTELRKMKGFVVAEVTADGCWVPKKKPSPDGYIITSWDGASRLVHNIVKQLVDMPAIATALQDPALIRIVETTRSLPTGWEGHHTCRNRACCNPAHIQIENQADHHREHNPSRVAAIREKVAQYPKFEAHFKDSVKAGHLPTTEEMIEWGMTIAVIEKARPMWLKEMGIAGGRSGRVNLEADLAPAREAVLRARRAGLRVPSSAKLAAMTGVPEGTVYSYRKQWLAAA